MESGSSGRTACYIAGTHWDREWYEPFQEYRLWLVQTMDGVIDHLRLNLDFGPFHLDGQAVMIEDYLAICPERRGEVVSFLESGRLRAGPWYVMPDLWLVSGESMIRNLNKGMASVRRLGGRPASVAYTPDLFGHPASMPMIYRGLGLEYCVMWRGLNDSQVPSLFRWISPDGSSVLTHHLPDNAGYGWFGALARWPWENASFSREMLEKILPELMEGEFQRAKGVPVIYLSDAGDHQMLPEDACRLLEEARKICPQIEFTQVSMEDYFQKVDGLETVDWQGELRSVAQKTGTLYHALIPHGLSSRYPLKLKHDRCQELLVRWAEPMAALAVMEASPTHRGFLDLSWEYLLLNQPHDSICGCSIDETHDDMPYRFHQSELLADGVRRQSIARIVPASAKGSDFANVVVWNPLPWSRLGVQQVEIFFPTTFPAKAKRSGHLGPSVNQFQLFDSHGSLLPFQILEVQTNVTRKGPDSLGRRALLTGPLDVYLLAVEIDLPPTGYAGFEVQPLDASLERQTGTLRTGALSAANEHLSIHVHDSGRVDLIDKASGRAYLDLFAYEDSGDAGDGWNFVPPLRNRIIVGPGDSVTVCVEEDGPLVVTFCIDRRFRLPVGLDPLSRESRVDKTEDVLVRDFLSLRKGEKFLRVRTDVKNTVGNHRLKVLLPTHVESDTYWSDQPFAWVERPIATDPGSARYKEPDPIERPHHSVIAIGNQSGGLAVLTPEGLHEHSISDDPSRTIGLTLFRAVDKTHTTDGEPQGQLLQAMDFSYALLPFQGSKPPQEILRVVAELQAGIYCHHASKTLTRQSWLRLDGPSCVSLSCIKPADSGNGLVVRLWNSSNAPVQSKIIVSKPIREGWSCDLQESIISRLNLDGDCLSLDVPAFGLITVFLQL